MTDIMDDMSNFAEEANKLEKEIQTKASQLFDRAFEAFWNRFTNIHAVVWAQYTPYFMDGDPCVFGVDEFYPMNEKAYKEWKKGNQFHPDEMDIIKTDWDGYKATGYKNRENFESINPDFEDGKITIKELEEAKDLLIKLRSCVDEETFLIRFGDHCIVTATRNGFEVKEYEHD